jgi:hypothetical protein
VRGNTRASRHVRVAAFLAPLAFFVGINASPPLANAVVSTARAFGIRRALWPDVSDLVALIVSPIAWRLVFMRTTGRAPDFQSRLSARTGLVAAAVACGATSLPPAERVPGFVVNQTTADQVIRVRALSTPGACTESLVNLAASRADWDVSPGPGVAVSLAPAAVGLLDETWLRAGTKGFDCASAVAFEPEPEEPCVLHEVRHPVAGAVFVRSQPVNKAACDAVAAAVGALVLGNRPTRHGWRICGESRRLAA